MSSSSSSSFANRPVRDRPPPPHIRLNSGTADIRRDDDAYSPSPSPSPSTPMTPSARPLLGPSSPAVSSAGRPAAYFDTLLPPPPSGATAAAVSSAASSRRSSCSSHPEGRLSPFASPFDDSRSPSRAGTDDDDDDYHRTDPSKHDYAYFHDTDAENLNTQTVSQKYNILPTAALLLYPEDVEKDDYLHNPDAHEADARDCNIFTVRGVVNVGGLALITIGVLMLFIGYPILTFVRGRLEPAVKSCSSIPNCIDVGPIPLLKGIRQGLVDADTPDSVKTRTTRTGKRQTLVFSDEFNKEGRTFYDGDDPYFSAVDLWYGVTMDLEWYDPDAVVVKDGTLNIRFDAFQNHGLNYRSGMLQSWNKLCFKGGYLEASISLPGRGDIMGFWPGFWAMGNLGRPGYAASTDGLWPYSYHDKCDYGITKNQSDPDGLSYLPGMRLPACTCSGQDHPNPGKSRSAPEIDALEASVNFLAPAKANGVGSASQSVQVAPFDVFWRPDYEYMELYDPTITGMNSYCGGNYQQAISGVTNLNNEWYDGKAYQRYAFEYVPGDKGYVSWYVGSDLTWTLDARAIGPNGNVGQRVIPQEPMAIVANFGMSNGFAEVNLAGLGALMPATMRIDYIRIYQDEGQQSMTCDPPDYPTTDYIRNHAAAYNNPNLTHWESRYDWPKNSFVDNCS